MNLYVKVRNDVKIFVEDLNRESEHTILFIHGWPLNHNMWEYQVGYLIELGYRCVSIDLRGYGQSDRPTNGYDYDTMASDIKGVIDSLKLNNITLVGHSMGGAIAVRYIAKYKAHGVSKLCLLSAAVPSFSPTENWEYGTPIDKIDYYIAECYSDRPHLITEIKNIFFYQFVTSETAQWFTNLCLQASGWATAKSLAALSREHLFNDVKQIQVPTLILHGVHDKICPIEFATYMNENIKDSKLIQLQQSGHGAFFEQKAEVSKEIDKFARR